jgi:hypothetical protein
MKIHFHMLLTTMILLSFSGRSFSQDPPLRIDKFYTMSGFGFSFPVGGSANFMRPKFSTTVGANIGLGNGRLFLYPKISLHVFGYDNALTEQDFRKREIHNLHLQRRTGLPQDRQELCFLRIFRRRCRLHTHSQDCSEPGNEHRAFK